MHQDQKYFLASLVTLEVENTLFRIPREFLQSSKEFTTQYLPSADVCSCCGSPSTNVKCSGAVDYVKLRDVKIEDFRAFLELLFPLPCVKLADAPLTYTEDTLERALYLSTTWGFQAVRKACIKHLDEVIIGARRIQFARKYNIQSWVAPEIKRLVSRPKSLSAEEAEQVGMETLVQIAHYRDLRFDYLSELVSELDLRAVGSADALFDEASARIGWTVCADMRTKNAETGKAEPGNEWIRLLEETELQLQRHWEVLRASRYNKTRSTSPKLVPPPSPCMDRNRMDLESPSPCFSRMPQRRYQDVYDYLEDEHSSPTHSDPPLPRSSSINPKPPISLSTRPSEVKALRSPVLCSSMRSCASMYDLPKSSSQTPAYDTSHLPSPLTSSPSQHSFVPRSTMASPTALYSRPPSLKSVTPIQVQISQSRVPSSISPVSPYLIYRPSSRSDSDSEQFEYSG